MYDYTPIQSVTSSANIVLAKGNSGMVKYHCNVAVYKRWSRKKENMMKKRTHQIQSILSVLFCAALVLSLPVLASAEDTGSAGQRAIEATGDQKYIQMPESDNYLDEFQTKYIDVESVLTMKPNGKVTPLWHSAPVERKPDRKGGLQMPFAFQGSKVTVVAEKNDGKRDYSCIIYQTSDYRMRAGWIWDIYLSDTDPSRTASIGKENNSVSGSIAEIPCSWSNEGFLGGQQRYTILEDEVENCVGFTLEYQLLKENTDRWELILGPRSVYVFDGHEWVEAGAFAYPEFGTVKVKVGLEKPTTVVAIGTKAHCCLPNTFFFRQLPTNFEIAP